MFHPRTLLNIQPYVSFWSFIFFTPQQMNKFSSFYNYALYQITCTMMYILSVKPCDTPRYVFLFYRPAHHRNWLQLLTPTLNITNCHMYMSKVLPAGALCYVTQCHQCALCYVTQCLQCALCYVTQCHQCAQCYVTQCLQCAQCYVTQCHQCAQCYVTQCHQCAQCYVTQCLQCAQCYVTQCHQYTPDCLSWRGGFFYLFSLGKLWQVSTEKGKSWNVSDISRVNRIITQRMVKGGCVCLFVCYII